MGEKVFLKKLVACVFLMAMTVHVSAAQQSKRVADLVKKLHGTSTNPPMLVIAHRSCWWDGAPENSLARDARVHCDGCRWHRDGCGED
jgi:hypothetical protein